MTIPMAWIRKKETTIEKEKAPKTWNMWSDEVAEKRMKIRDYGGYHKFVNRGHSAKSFKEQALLELAARLTLEDEISELKKQISQLTDKLDALQP